MPIRVTAPTGYPTLARRRGVTVAASHGTVGRQCWPAVSQVTALFGPRLSARTPLAISVRAVPPELGTASSRPALATEAPGAARGARPQPATASRARSKRCRQPHLPPGLVLRRRRFLDSSRSSVYDRPAVLENRFSNRPYPTGGSPGNRINGGKDEGACQMGAACGHTSS